MRNRGRFLLWTFVLLCVAAPATAQVRVSGRVVANDTGEPLAGAEITARSTGGRFLRHAVTGTDGRFEFIIQRTAAVDLRASHSGYEANTAPTLYFDEHTFFEIEIRLDPDVVLLAPLAVVGRSAGPSPFLEEFRERVKRGLGVYITRAQIERQQPMYVTDLLRDIPGVQLRAVGIGSRPVVAMGRSSGRMCSARIFVDGMLLNPTMMTPSGPRADVFRIDDVVHPSSVEGIEIYRGMSTTPPEFLTADADCGVIAIWTRRGG
jgi:hypothetical protein